MPKRYRQWLFDDNVPKPRTTKFRHERSARMSSLSSELEHAPPTGDEGPSEAPGEGGSETSGDEDRQSVWESGQVDCGAGSSMDDTNIGAHRSDTPRQQEGSLEWANITESSSTDTSDDDSASMTEDVAKTELDEPLYPGSRITRGESLVLILAHSLRHGATKEATESVLKLLEAHLPEHAALPTSKYLFFKEFLSSHQTMSYHFYCPKCLEYLGSREEEPLRCNTCSVEFDMNTLTKEFSYFLSFDIGEQVKEKLSAPELDFKQLSRSLAFDVGEITTSKGYHDLPTCDNDLSVTWNTDGVPLYESSGYSIWPLLLQINELPHTLRSKHMLLAGLWFGPKKPVMNTFLKPFVHQMNILSSTGIVCVDSQGNSNTIRIFPGPCTVDTVARAMVMNMNQFNGSHGCGWCVHGGEVVPKGHGHVRVYPIVSPQPSARTHQSFLDCASDAEESGEPTWGIKGQNILFLLTFFSFPASFVVDYMHAVCCGFVRQTTCMWFDTRTAFSYSIGSLVSEVDRRLHDVRPVWEIARLPRSLTLRRYWKASEWQHWLLFYSPIVLRGLLPHAYYDNWIQFVGLMHFFLSDTIPTEKLRQARKDMISFLKRYQELYGKEQMTYNSHLLLHLPDSVQTWGPLWNYSAYGFESMNGQLVRFVNGTRYAQWQVIEKFSYLSALPLLWEKCAHFESKDSKQELMQYFLKGYHLRRHAISIGGVVLYGKGKTEGQGMSYKKVRISGLTYCVQSLDKSRRHNSYIRISGSFGIITKITAVCSLRHSQCTCAKQIVFQVTRLATARSFLDCFCGTLVYEVVHTDEVLDMGSDHVEKCIVLQHSPKILLCPIKRASIFSAM